MLDLREQTRREGLAHEEEAERHADVDGCELSVILGNLCLQVLRYAMALTLHQIGVCGQRVCIRPIGCATQVCTRSAYKDAVEECDHHVGCALLEGDEDACYRLVDAEGDECAEELCRGDERERRIEQPWYL